MPSVRISNVSFGYDDAHPVLNDINLTLDAGWHGLVGANGAGKSTLVALVVGALTPGDGHIARAADLARVAWVPQQTRMRTPALEALSLRQDRAASRWRGRLAVDPSYVERWDTLSAGERMRVHLCAALVDEPDLLVLDEPTNHLDCSARELVLRALQRFAGVGLLVSHDRSWLDTLCSQTVWIEDGTARAWAGGYTAAAGGRALEREAAQAARSVARRDVARLARSADKTQRARASAESMISAKRRARSPKDSDARGVLARTRAEWAEARLGRSVATHNARLARAQQALAELPEVRKARGRGVAFEATAGGGAIVLSLRGEDVWAGDRVLLHDVRLTLRRGERVWLRGDNGAGKTTLLGALMATRSPRTLYVPQELDGDGVARHQRALRELPPEARGRAYQRLAALGCDPSVVATSPTPSAGEARKLALAAGLSRPLDAILLDEPTNHLDLPSIQRLEDALREFPGALVIVSHDQRFTQSLCELTWSIEDGEVR
jgi:ATPase subunit of ABC transporter with duplicated ATPase domains